MDNKIDLMGGQSAWIRAIACLMILVLTGSISIINGNWSAFKAGAVIVFVVVPVITILLGLFDLFVGDKKIKALISIILAVFVLVSDAYVWSNKTKIEENARQQVTTQVKKEVSEEVKKTMDNTKKQSQDYLNGLLDKLGL